MNTQQKIQIKRIKNIIIAWTLVGVFIAIYDHLLLHSNLSSGHFELYSFGLTLAFNVFAGIIGGFLGGLLLTTINQKFRFKPYSYGLKWGFLGFVSVVIFITLITSIITTIYVHGFNFSTPEASAFFKEQILNTLHLKNLLFWSIVTLLTQFTIQLSEKFGPGNLWNILSGKYHIPKREPRIFMFLDLKSSTTIAEKLGEAKYHEFLQDVFSDITDPINNCKAEIYQYVGDEVIISWHLDKLKNRPFCLDVFFEIEEEFKIKKEDYLQKYDTIPRFKAGAHIGNAIAGEIGIIKRDITYSGDLLNTAARIQGQCNDFNSVFLISGQLKDYLSNYLDKWIFESKGFISLKGKMTKVELLDIQKK